MRDPYEILGVARGASFEEIKAAYRRACLKRHPDMPGGSHEAMVELSAGLAARAPALITVDDLQWCDRASLEWPQA